MLTITCSTLPLDAFVVKTIAPLMMPIPQENISGAVRHKSAAKIRRACSPVMDHIILSLLVGVVPRTRQMRSTKVLKTQAKAAARTRQGNGKPPGSYRIGLRNTIPKNVRKQTATGSKIARTALPISVWKKPL